MQWAAEERSRRRPGADGFNFVLSLFGAVLPSVAATWLNGRTINRT